MNSERLAANGSSSSREISSGCPYRGRFTAYGIGLASTFGGLAVGLMGLYVTALTDSKIEDTDYPWTDIEKRRARAGVATGNLLALAAGALYWFFIDNYL